MQVYRLIVYMQLYTLIVYVRKYNTNTSSTKHTLAMSSLIKHVGRDDSLSHRGYRIRILLLLLY